MSARIHRRLDHTTAHAADSATVEMALADHPTHDPVWTRKVVELAVDVAELALASGASAATTNLLAHRVVLAYGLPATVDITYNRLAVSHETPQDEPPLTLVRVAPKSATDYDQLGRVEHLVDKMEQGRLDVAVAAERIGHVKATPRRYRRWAVALASMLLGGAIAALMGGKLPDVLWCMFATLLVETFRDGLTLRGASGFFTQAIAATPPTALGLLVMATRNHIPAVVRPSASMVVAAGMVSLLAGIGIVMAAADAVDGYYVTCGGRMIEVVVMTSAIVLGLVGTLWVGINLGVPGHLALETNSTAAPLLQPVYGALIAAAIAVTCNVHPHSLPVVAVFGALAQLVAVGAAQLTGQSAGQAAIAAVVVGLLARLLRRRVKVPSVAVVTTAIAALMPGMLLYRGVFGLVVREEGTRTTSPTTLLLKCALTAVALAAGSSFGMSLAGLAQRAVDRGPRHLLRVPEERRRHKVQGPLFS